MSQFGLNFRWGSEGWGWQSPPRVMQESNWKEKTGRPAVQLFTSLQIARVLHQHTVRRNISGHHCHKSFIIQRFSGNICSLIGRFGAMVITIHSAIVGTADSSTAPFRPTDNVIRVTFLSLISFTLSTPFPSFFLCLSFSSICFGIAKKPITIQQRKWSLQMAIQFMYTSLVLLSIYIYMLLLQLVFLIVGLEISMSAPLQEDYTGWNVYYRKYVLHQLKRTWNMRLRRCSTDLR